MLKKRHYRAHLSLTVVNCIFILTGLAFKDVIKSSNQLAKLLPKWAVIFLHILGISTTTIYGSYHLIYDNTIIGGFLGLAGLTGMASFYCVQSNKNNQKLLLLYVLLLGCALVITSYHYGYRGLIFLFPYTASLFYLAGYRLAIISTILFCTCSLIAALNVMETVVVLRYLVALIVSIGFSVCYAHVMGQQKKQLEKDAHYDALTGITNRRQFSHWLNSVLEEPSLTKKIALFYIDIDDFKHINDNFGHALGDEVLKKFCERILTVIRQSELIMGKNKIYNFARLAGDEFVIAIIDLDQVDSAKRIAERLLESIEFPFELSSSSVKINLSIGVVYTEGKISAEMLLHNADSSMYRAKKNGKNTYYLFDETISDEIARRKDIENNIHRSLDKNLFSLSYMPIYTMSETPVISGVEALIRCNSDSFAGLGPEKFIPIAEASGQIKAIDLWVLKTTFADINKLKNKSPFEKIWYSINISSTELMDSDFIEQIQRLLDNYQISPDTIHLEITETKLVPYENIIIERMKRLRELNFHLSLDDYGTGYTGFAQLLNFPGDYIKIDRSFVSEIGKGESNYTKMIGVMLSIAKIYGLKVIAEGVETQEQLDYLKQLGCQYAQGYYFSKALVLDDLINLVENSARN